MMIVVAKLVISLLLIVAAIFGIVGSWGLVRLPDPMTRLHAPTKAATLGVGGVLIASMLSFAILHGEPSWHELLIALFLFLTAPVTGLFIAKAHMHRSWDRDELPVPGPGVDWVTYGHGADDPELVEKAKGELGE